MTVALDESPRRMDFAVNEQQPNRSIVPSGLILVSVPILRATVRGQILLTSVAGVKAASAPGAQGVYGLPERPASLRRPIAGAEIDVFFTVGPDGIPTLNVPMRELPGSELLPDTLKTFVASLQNLTLPFAVGEAFAEVLEDDRTRVVNAGVVRTEGGIDMRLEFEPAPANDPAARAQRAEAWQQFFSGGFPSHLDGKDWAIVLPSSALAAKAAKELDDQFKDPELSKHVSPGGPTSSQFIPQWPGFVFTKDAILRNACSGMDVRAELEAVMAFSVPAPDTLRMSAALDADPDEWDAFKCTVVSMLNPFAGAITTFDKSLPWYATPVVGVLLTLVPLAWGLGLGDALVMKEVIKAAQEEANKQGGPQIVRTSANTFYVDMAKKITTALTRDWLIVETVAGFGDRLVIRGTLTAPDLTLLPRLRGTLSDPFEYWSKKNRCSSNVEWQTVATLTLDLVDEQGTPVKAPVPLRYGVDVEPLDATQASGGQATWRIVDDTTGVYRSSATRIHWTGAPPGVFEVQVTHPPEPYRSAPAPFRMQLFTSFGVREFEIPAPPPMPKPPQTKAEQTAEAAERIANCYIYSSLLARVKALQVFWLPNPPPDGELDVAQHWQVLIRGLEAEHGIRAWEPEGRELLAEVSPYSGGLAELSLTLQPEQTIRALQLTLNDAEPLSLRTYARRAAALRGRKATGPYEVLIRQTPLYRVATVPLAEAAETLVPERDGDSLRLLAGRTGGVDRIALDALEPRRPALTARLDGGATIRPQVPSASIRVQPILYGGRAATELFESAVAGDRLVARYFRRPWYDRGGVAGKFFAQLEEDGTAVRVFVRGATRDVPPDIGNRDQAEPHRPRGRARAAATD